MFDSEQKETPSTEQPGFADPNPQPPSSQFDTLLSEIRNERGERKYNSVEDGLNALKHSQEYIYKVQLEKQRLEAELEEARRKAAEIDELKATVAKLTQRGSEPAPQVPQIDEEKLAHLVDTRLTLKQQEALARNNQKAVAQKLTETFGEKAKDVFYEKASQMGLSSEEIESLAARSPKAVLTMFGLDGDVAHKQTLKSPAPSRVNTETFQGKPTTFIGAETERVPLGGGTQHYNRILENAKNMVEELHQNGMTIDDLTDPVKYMQYFKNKG